MDDNDTGTDAVIGGEAGHDPAIQAVGERAQHENINQPSSHEGGDAEIISGGGKGVELANDAIDHRVAERGVIPRRAAPPYNRAIKVRVPWKDLVRIRADAKVAAVSVSEIVRRRYFGRPIIARVDMVMVRELRRQGALLLLAMQTGGRPEVQAALLKVGAAIDAVSASRREP